MPDTTTNADTTDDATRSRIVRYDEYFDLRTFAMTWRKTTNSSISKKLSHKKPVLVVLRSIDDKGRYNGTKVNIRSAPLCQVLIDIIRDVENPTLTSHQPVMDSKELFHCRPGLLKRLDQEKTRPEPDTVLIADLSTALQYIQEDFAALVEKFDKISDSHQISFLDLWALFPPNVLSYRWHIYTEQQQILLTQTFEYRARRSGDLYAYIECDVINNDGNSFGIARESIEIDVYRGARRVQDLILFPLDYHPDKEKIREAAIKRGKRFASLPQHSYNNISGPAMKEKTNDRWETRQFKFSTHGRVMIDPKAFRLFEPNCTFNRRVHRTLEQDSLTEDHYMICTPIVLGFCFGVKTWGGFALDRLRDIDWSDEAFRSLVLGAKQKTLVHALVKSHKFHTETFDDFVEGKGKGLIGLFSGNPGCGKTLTAEAVAEATRRPLYSVSAGELGTSPKELDERLALVLEMAQTWDAVCLLDEAEVFLQERGNDVVRNALVSIFLRQLEFYQGILILTTNRIEQCDPAFESRIHFSIHYPDLGFDSRKQIWQTFLTKVLKNSSDITPEHLDRLATLPMNGRQIKNAVSSAQCVALDAQEDLSITHIDAVLDVVDDWAVAKGHVGNR
ncbi:P-loop containing nucleoside triphosphate hydrolase protein [Mycena sanguinolenta]|nr:P-loop containing nucleoside triphosphate hydrolase protein [Mycena sanguinolenta]